MKIIGLTGGIASGKTTVASILLGFGATIIDADKVAREVVEPGKPAWQEIREVFGDNVLLSGGNINRKYLGELIFNDPKKRNLLNSIIHPRVKDEFENRLKYFKQINNPIVFLEVPLLLETGMDNMVDEVWLVVVNMETQIQRNIKRDRISRGQAIKRIESQMPIEDKKKRADIIIDGQLELNELQSYLKSLWNNILPNGVEVKEKDQAMNRGE